MEISDDKAPPGPSGSVPRLSTAKEKCRTLRPPPAPPNGQQSPRLGPQPETIRAPCPPCPRPTNKTNSLWCGWPWPLNWKSRPGMPGRGGLRMWPWGAPSPLPALFPGRMRRPTRGPAGLADFTHHGAAVGQSSTPPKSLCRTGNPFSPRVVAPFVPDTVSAPVPFPLSFVPVFTPASGHLSPPRKPPASWAEWRRCPPGKSVFQAKEKTKIENHASHSRAPPPAPPAPPP